MMRLSELDEDLVRLRSQEHPAGIGLNGIRRLDRLGHHKLRETSLTL